MKPRPIEEALDPLFAKGLPALVRARKRAEEIALRTNTALVQVVDGKVVRVYPKAADNGSDSPTGRKTNAG